MIYGEDPNFFQFNCAVLGYDYEEWIPGPGQEKPEAVVPFDADELTKWEIEQQRRIGANAIQVALSRQQNLAEPNRREMVRVRKWEERRRRNPRPLSTRSEDFQTKVNDARVKIAVAIDEVERMEQAMANPNVNQNKSQTDEDQRDYAARNMLDQAMAYGVREDDQTTFNLALKL